MDPYTRAGNRSGSGAVTQCQRPVAQGPDLHLGAGYPTPDDLAAQHRDLVAQDEYLHVLGSGTASEEPEPAEHPYRDQVQQSEQHSPRSCRDPRGDPKRQVTERAWSFGTVQPPGKLLVADSSPLGTDNCAPVAISDKDYNESF